jgi:peptide/nickel transport system substrate-binding protein
MPQRFTARALTPVLALIATVSTASAAETDITIGMQLEPPHLDPTSAAAGAIDNVVYSNIFEGLTRFMGDGSVVPGLAKSWDISDDGLSYTFHLQGDVRFHDGSAMDAADVKFSL